MKTSTKWMIGIAAALVLFFLLISGGDAGVFFAHLANIADRFLGAEQGRQVGFPPLAPRSGFSRLAGSFGADRASDDGEGPLGVGHPCA